MAYGVFAPRISQAAPPDASYELALSQFRSGKYREATATLRGALEQYPQNAQFELLLARCYYEMGDLNRATEHAESAADIDPSSSEAHLWLGQVYGRQAEQSHSLILASKTRKEFEKAVELAPHNIEARRDLMEFYLQAPWLLGGSRDKARKQVDAIWHPPACEPYPCFRPEARAPEDRIPSNRAALRYCEARAPQLSQTLSGSSMRESGCVIAPPGVHRPVPATNGLLNWKDRYLPLTRHVPWRGSSLPFRNNSEPGAAQTAHSADIALMRRAVSPWLPDICRTETGLTQAHRKRRAAQPG